MSDELRDRIARVLFGRDQIRLEQRGYFKVEWGDNVADWDAYVKPWLDEAQAVIDEFGLTTEERLTEFGIDDPGYQERVVGKWEET